MLDVVLKKFENPHEVRTFEKGKVEIVRVGGMVIGKATFLVRIRIRSRLIARNPDPFVSHN